MVVYGAGQSFNALLIFSGVRAEKSDEHHQRAEAGIDRGKYPRFGPN